MQEQISEITEERRMYLQVGLNVLHTVGFFTGLVSYDAEYLEDSDDLVTEIHPPNKLEIEDIEYCDHIIIHNPENPTELHMEYLNHILHILRKKGFETDVDGFPIKHEDDLTKETFEIASYYNIWKPRCIIKIGESKCGTT